MGDLFERDSAGDEVAFEVGGDLGLADAVVVFLVLPANQLGHGQSFDLLHGQAVREHVRA